MSYTAIDLSTLPAPDVIEALDFETILAALREDVLNRAPELAGALALESEPLNILLEVFAYRELIVRARVNDAARAVLLSYATGSDLEHLGALFNVSRLIVQAADPDATPPVPEILETDTALRARIQIALEGYTTAGSVGAYEFHARSVSGRVSDVDVFAPESAGAYTGEVEVTILTIDNDGIPDQDLLNTIALALNAEHVRPLTDRVSVLAPAATLEYAIEAQLKLYDGPSSSVVQAAAQAALDAYIAARRTLGSDVTRSGIFAALHQPGVQNVILISPANDVVVAHNAIARCTGVSISVTGVDD